MIDAHALEAVIDPPLEPDLEVVEVGCVERDVVHPRRQSEAGRDLGAVAVERRARGGPRSRASRRCRCRRRGDGPTRPRVWARPRPSRARSPWPRCRSGASRRDPWLRLLRGGMPCAQSGTVSDHGPSGERGLGRRGLFAVGDWVARRPGRRAPARVRLQARDDCSRSSSSAVASHPAAGAGARQHWFVAALVCSLVGDVLLMLPREQFVAGLSAFLVAHVCYLAGFWTDGPSLVRVDRAAVVGGCGGDRVGSPDGCCLPFGATIRRFWARSPPI